jgi:pimeloyl-ACP methyl ester carboxylesterase
MGLDGSTRAAALLLALSLSGCFHMIEDHCRGCTIVSDRAPTPLFVPADTHAVVLLIGGALGFGEEWRPVVDELARRRHVVTVGFKWSGPFGRKPSLTAAALEGVLQQIVDALPPKAQLLVIAHSAGGALTAYVAARLRVPAGRRLGYRRDGARYARKEASVRIVSIAGADDMNLARWQPDERVNTPLGFAVGGEQPQRNIVAPGIDYVQYVTADAPRVPVAPKLQGARRVYLGAHVGHNPSIAVAALPLVRGL